MTFSHVLTGCAPEPMARYLKALGILRLVGEQADPSATGHWTPQGFVLSTALSWDELIGFVLDDYAPTPVVSPWNGGSGFWPKDNQDGIGPIERSVAPRWAAYRVAISCARAIVASFTTPKDDKARLLLECRSQLPDDCLPWLDAAAVLTAGGPKYPPLLGTGGNDGRLDFSNNFMQRLVEVFGLETKRPPARAATTDLIVTALLADRSSPGAKVPIGQFDPGAAGGPNSATAGAADSVVNPVDYVLLVEGSMVLASGTARRLSSAAGSKAAIPFTFDSVPVGYASAAADEDTRGEVWVPLWERPTRLDEVVRLFGEARCEWRGGPARTGLDAARAIGTLGTDRGIDGFSRHALLTRNGLATFLVPVGRLSTGDRPSIAITATLDPWLDRVRRGANPPAEVSRRLRLVERSLFQVAVRGDGPSLVTLLADMARLERCVARASTFRVRIDIDPLRLDGTSWLAALTDDDLLMTEPEFRLAMSLASLRDDGAEHPTLRSLVCPVTMDRGRPWSVGPVVDGFAVRPVVAVLSQALARRSIEFAQGRATALPFPRGISADPFDCADLSGGHVDIDRLGERLGALLLLQWAGVSAAPVRNRSPHVDSPALSALAPFFATPALAGPVGVPLVPDQRWPAMLNAGNTAEVLAMALQRLRIAGYRPPVRHAAPLTVGLAGPEHLATALLCRLGTADRVALLRRTSPPLLEDEPTRVTTDLTLGGAHAALATEEGTDR